MNRYYLVDLGAVLANRKIRLNQVEAGLPANARRVLANQLLHYAVSLDGELLLAQAETNDTEHAWILARGWITYLGDYDPITGSCAAVLDYFVAHPESWGARDGVLA